MRLTRNLREQLVALVMEQLQEDLRSNEFDSVYALLLSSPRDALVGFLPDSTKEYWVGLNSQQG